MSWVCLSDSTFLYKQRSTESRLWDHTPQPHQTMTRDTSIWSSRPTLRVTSVFSSISSNWVKMFALEVQRVNSSMTRISHTTSVWLQVVPVLPQCFKWVQTYLFTYLTRSHRLFALFLKTHATQLKSIWSTRMSHSMTSSWRKKSTTLSSKSKIMERTD